MIVTIRLALDHQEGIMPNHKSLLTLATLFSLSVPAWGQTVTCSSDDGKRHHCNADHSVRERSEIDFKTHLPHPSELD